MSVRIGSCFAVLVLAATISVAQTTVAPGAGTAGPGVLTGVFSSVSTSGGVVSQSAGSGNISISTAGFGIMSAVSGAPYSGEQVGQTVQTLADGTHITRNSTPAQRTWRDSQGRTRTERQLGMSSRPNAPKPPVIIEIRDPVAGVGYILDTQAKVAHRITAQQPAGAMAVRPINPAMMQSRVVSSSSVTAEGVENKTESLGNQTIEGVTAFGTRTTTVYPVNYDGNDRPITTTAETWISPELGLTLLMKRNDPRNGEMTQKIINLSRVEPDLTLFQPPSDYSVVDETGPMVSIRYALQ